MGELLNQGRETFNTEGCVRQDATEFAQPGRGAMDIDELYARGARREHCPTC